MRQLAPQGVLILLSLGLFAAPAQAADAGAGQRIADEWCSQCHIVRPSQTTASDLAPPFTQIAKREDLSYLEAWLADPHPPMPQLNLTKREISDLIAYIESLRGQ